MRPERIVGVAGEVLLTFGAVLLLYAAYLLWGTSVEAHQEQAVLRAQLTQSTRAVAAPEWTPRLGEPYATITIPRFGTSWQWVVVEGTRKQDLVRGPGHYPNTADPGEVGNVAIAGHRSGQGEPFGPFDDLRAGDLVRLRTPAGTWTYRLDLDPERIGPRDSWVLDPVPGERRITLTTCWPRYGSSHRLYVTGVLIDERRS
jgi:sortase A